MRGGASGPRAGLCRPKIFGRGYETPNFGGPLNRGFRSLSLSYPRGYSPVTRLSAYSRTQSFHALPAGLWDFDAEWKTHRLRSTGAAAAYYNTFTMRTSDNRICSTVWPVFAFAKHPSAQLVGCPRPRWRGDCNHSLRGRGRQVDLDQHGRVSAVGWRPPDLLPRAKERQRGSGPFEKWRDFRPRSADGCR